MLNLKEHAILHWSQQIACDIPTHVRISRALDGNFDFKNIEFFHWKCDNLWVTKQGGTLNTIAELK